MSKIAASEPRTIVLERRPRELIDVPIVGTTELIMHAWAEKTRGSILSKQMGKPVGKKPPKDPEQDYQQAFYRTVEGLPGLPVTAFKKAIADAARKFDGITMTLLKQSIHIHGDAANASDGPPLILIVGEPRMRQDTVRNETGVVDIRFRPGFPQWEATLHIEYDANLLTPEAVVALVDAAGEGGVGDWRPSAPKSTGGWAGCFSVKRE